MSSDVPLTERKQRRARARIVEAADELFTAHGFDAVSVNDIAERAEVGRTTFFRYFGDKQEVVFAREQELLDLIAAEHVTGPASGSQTATEALRALEPVFLRLCERMTADPDDFQRHTDLIGTHVELQGRSAAKMRVVALRLGALLVAEGWTERTASLAAEIALACYWTAYETSAGPSELVDATRDAFRRALELGVGKRRR